MRLISFRFNRFVVVSLLGLSASVFQAPAHAQLPSLGDGSDMTLAAERKLGERIVRDIYRDPQYIEDALLSEYVGDIWAPLMAAARARGEITPELEERFAWEILLIRDRSVNAFALPGGFMGVHLGLIAVVTSRDELASVLAHEMSHVTQRHIARMFAQQGRQMPWLIGAMILGALAASKSPDAAQAAIVGGQALAVQNQLTFSRDMEREADRIGYGVMGQAGFQMQGFVTMFEKLQQASRLNDNGSYPYLRSHPLTSERIADMQLRQQFGGPSVVPQPLLMEHMMLSARARTLANPAVDASRAAMVLAQSSGSSPVNTARQAGDLYAAVLAAARLREFDRAREFNARLSALAAADPRAARLSRLLEVEVSLMAGDVPAALARLDTTAKDRPELLLSAQALARAGKGGEMVQPLQNWVTAHPRDGAAWQLLGSALAAQGQRLRSLRAEAEAQVVRLDYAAAVDRFKAAQELIRQGEAGRNSGDHIEASIIDARLREVESLLREQRLER
jgi:predicted Zn-dependent protease